MNNNNDNEHRARGINKTPKQQPTRNTNNKIQNKERKQTINQPEHLQHAKTRSRNKEHKNTEQRTKTNTTSNIKIMSNYRFKKQKTKSTEQQQQ